MKALSWIVGIVIVLIIGFFALNSYIYNEKQGDGSMNDTATTTENTAVQVTPITHATMTLRFGDTLVLADPVGEASLFTSVPTPNVIVVTDIHGDHFSTSTLKTIMGSSTALVVPQVVKDLLPADLAARAIVLKNDAATTTNGLNILAVPMYNLPGAANSSFHTKGRGNGYIIEKDGTRVYIAGDTAGTPEMRALKDIDIAFVPMNMPYTMTVEEAADAVLAFKPKIVYPYHYRGQDGLSDVNHFKELVNTGDSSINVIIGNWYPEGN